MINQEPPPWGPTIQENQHSDNRFDLTDMGNAKRFAEQNYLSACYTKTWGWLVWNGKYWEKDDTNKVVELAKITVRTIKAEADAVYDKAYKQAIKLPDSDEAGVIVTREMDESPKKELLELAEKIKRWGKLSQSNQRIKAMLDLAKSEEGIVARAEDFNHNNMTINLQNGILNLQSGELSAHDPKAKFTKILHAEYDPRADCPTWVSFLTDMFQGDKELIGFIQRAMGYSLTGDTSEQCFFFLYGSGSNGKSTFLNMVHEIFNDYAMKIRSESLMVKRYDSLPEEIAQLIGVRLLIASELDEGLQLNESLIKDLTGGDKLRARSLYKDSFEFTPTAKLWMYGNHKPHIRGMDDGIWRRTFLIPCEASFIGDKRDPTLPKKLQGEKSGILKWMLSGLKRWQEEGLNPPEVVKNATQSYRDEEDPYTKFLDECICRSAGDVLTSGIVFNCYKSWANRNGYTANGNAAFSRELQKRGYSISCKPDGSTKRDNDGRAFYENLSLSEYGTSLLNAGDNLYMDHHRGI